MNTCEPRSPLTAAHLLLTHRKRCCDAGQNVTDKAAIMISANNMLHYPFVAAFAQARARQESRRAHSEDEKHPELQAIDDAMLNSNLDMGAARSRLLQVAALRLLDYRQCVLRLALYLRQHRVAEADRSCFVYCCVHQAKEPQGNCVSGNLRPCAGDAMHRMRRHVLQASARRPVTMCGPRSAASPAAVGNSLSPATALRCSRAWLPHWSTIPRIAPQRRTTSGRRKMVSHSLAASKSASRRRRSRLCTASAVSDDRLQA